MQWKFTIIRVTFAAGFVLLAAVMIFAPFDMLTGTFGGGSKDVLQALAGLFGEPAARYLVGALAIATAVFIIRGPNSKGQP